MIVVRVSTKSAIPFLFHTSTNPSQPMWHVHSLTHSLTWADPYQGQAQDLAIYQREKNKPHWRSSLSSFSRRIAEDGGDNAQRAEKHTHIHASGLSVVMKKIPVSRVQQSRNVLPGEAEERKRQRFGGKLEELFQIKSPFSSIYWMILFEASAIFWCYHMAPIRETCMPLYIR
jgi:hypothetical protein